MIQKMFAIVVLFSCIACNNGSAQEDTVLKPSEFLQKLQEDNSAQLVDVRTVEEFSASHLRDAQNICVTDDDFEERVKALDKSQPVYVYCRSGGRSARAAKTLRDLGFERVYDLDGGILNWEKEGLETEQ
ncbi:rhodanese-like domain-containing protein [Flavobacteriaceae bacterium TK19130]|nr:rhodanese-like domain-containing protein [Thermobacterium salinum]